MTNLFMFVLIGTILVALFAKETSVSVQAISSAMQEDPAVTRFRQYLRINSSHPKPDYDGCIAWLKNQAFEIGLDFHIKRFKKPELFAVWLTWTGSDPSLQSIMFNSHMDVVPADYSRWDHDPFGAYKDDKGNIFGRGAQDDKSPTVLSLEALRRLKKSGFKPLRTIHINVVPDEELGGTLGMKPFVGSQEFKKLKVGFAVGENMISTDSGTIQIGFKQKQQWGFTYTAVGVTGHSSLLPETTAGQKLQIVINKIFEYRESQFRLLNSPNTTLSDVTTVNLVRLGGGIATNVIASEVWVTFDMRVRTKPGWNLTDVKKMLDQIAEDAGPGVSYKSDLTVQNGETIPDDSNVWWVELQKACKEMKKKCVAVVGNGSTDMRYVREIGIPAFGFHGIVGTTYLAHADNEFVNEKNFLDGIDRYKIFIERFSSVSEDRNP